MKTTLILSATLLANAAMAGETACFAQLIQGRMLARDEALCSPDGRFRTVLQGSDGNFVTYLVRPILGEPVRPIFALGASAARTTVDLKSDCDLVTYDEQSGQEQSLSHSAGKAKWCRLHLTNEGVLKVQTAVDPVVSHPVWDDYFRKELLWQQPAQGQIHWRGVFVGQDSFGARCELDIARHRFSINGYHYYLEGLYEGGWEGRPLRLSSSGYYAGNNTYTQFGSKWRTDLIWSRAYLDASITLDAKNVATAYSFRFKQGNKEQFGYCQGLRFE